MSGWRIHRSRTFLIFQRGPQRLTCWAPGLLGDFYKSDITFYGQLSPEEKLALSKQVVLSCWDFKSFLAKNKSIVENPKRWSASLTSGGRAALPHVHGTGLPVLIISSNLRSGGVAWLFPATGGCLLISWGPWEKNTNSALEQCLCLFIGNDPFLKILERMFVPVVLKPPPRPWSLIMSAVLRVQQIKAMHPSLPAGTKGKNKNSPTSSLGFPENKDRKLHLPEAICNDNWTQTTSAPAVLGSVGTRHSAHAHNSKICHVSVPGSVWRV